MMAVRAAARSRNNGAAQNGYRRQRGQHDGLWATPGLRCPSAGTMWTPDRVWDIRWRRGSVKAQPPASKACAGPTAYDALVFVPLPYRVALQKISVTALLERAGDIEKKRPRSRACGMEKPPRSAARVGSA